MFCFRAKDVHFLSCFLQTQRKLLAALVVAFAFMAVEVVGGIYAGSLAILTDAAHLLSDVSGFAMSALAAWTAARASEHPFSYGYHRVEVLGALASMLAVWLVTGVLVFEAVDRVRNPQPVNGRVMFLLAVVGIAVNVVLWMILGGHHHGHGHSHGDDHGHGGHNQAKKGKKCAGKGVHDHAHGHAHGHGHDQEDHDHEGLRAERGEQPSSLSRSRPASRSEARTLDSDEHVDVSPETAGLLLPAASRCSSTPSPPSDSPSVLAGLSLTLPEATPAKKSNLNLHGAVVHVIGDLVQSIGVALAGALIWWKQDDQRWALADPICTFFFALLVLRTTKGIMVDIAEVLMERAPRGLDIRAVNEAMHQVPGVVGVQDLHIWSLTPGITLLAAHVVVRPDADARLVVRRITDYANDIGIEHATIQINHDGEQ
ncbi:cation efflux family protein [Helicosporidium sp. ATCC 50920]|nr:cation efflux family protein [Helicosporidium sp. ATCC 50920]|eukprot:KDD76571.1 cation efflux family protein [Helicosporidium sp. ATCC 50920]